MPSMLQQVAKITWIYQNARKNMKFMIICHSPAKLLVLKFLRSFRNRRQISQCQDSERTEMELPLTVIFFF